MEKLLTIPNDKCPITEAEFDKVWQGGSIHYPEAVVLYNLVRVYQATRLLEAGAFVGMSTRFLIQGLPEGQKGHVISIDLQSTASAYMLLRHKAQRSYLLTREDLKRVTLVTAKAQDFMKTLDPGTIDFIFEDTSHNRRDTREIVTEAIRLLVPGGVLVSHDGGMVSVKEGYSEAGIQDNKILPCGLSIWRKQL